MSLFDIFYKLKIDLFKSETFDDFADRLSFKFSCFILSVASTVIIAKQYFMKPISCYIATEAGGKYLVDYLENYCWVEGTIPITFFENFPTNEKEWERADESKILYYQWVPFILALQALLCYIPQLMWRLFYISNNGKSMDRMIVKANKAVSLDEESRKKEVNHLVKVLETMIIETRDENENEKTTCLSVISKLYTYIVLGKRLGAYLMIFYLFIKILYFANAIGQIFLMQAFLNLNMTENRFFGTKIISDIINGKDWEVTSTFPRIGYCLAKLRHIGSVNLVVAQCSLPVNMLNEKLYIFLWFWMVVLAVVTGVSIFAWIFKLYIEYNKTSFLEKYLKLNDVQKYKDIQKPLIRKFEKRFLKNNGLFVLRLIASNAGDLITAEIVMKLFDTFLKTCCNSRKSVIKLHDKLSSRRKFSNVENKKLLQTFPSAPNEYTEDIEDKEGKLKNQTASDDRELRPGSKSDVNQHKVSWIASLRITDKPLVNEQQN